MAELISNERLNDLLIDTARSLMQYVGESWPWVDADEQDERDVVLRIVAEQQETVRQLAALLDSRGHRITYGTYPSEYTSLHYVALDYLLDQLIAQQRMLEEEFAEAAQEALDDQEAHSVLTGAAEQAARHRRELEALVDRRKKRTAANAA